MTGALPLSGKRILTTRASAQAGGLVQALEQRGAKVLRLATIEILPPSSYDVLDNALREIEKFDWLILTSANGAAALGSRARLLGITPARFAHLEVAAIGPATAQAARREGLLPSTVPEKHVAEAVVASLKDKVPGKRVLLVRAAVGRDIIPQQLAQCGASVEVAEAYRTCLPDSSAEEINRLLGGANPLPDAITFTSSSTVDNFFTLLRAANTALPPNLRAISIGPITSGTLREHGWEPAAEALQSNIPGLVEACERLLSEIL